MKITSILSILLMVISIVFTACSNTAPTISPPTTQAPTQQAPLTTPPTKTTPDSITIQQPAPSKIPIPTPKFATPGTGAIVGQVAFPDGSPAYRAVVFIFSENETSSFASCYININGYYMFDDLPPKHYKIYVASYGSFLGFAGEPYAVATVSERQIENIPTLKILGHIEISFDNPKTAHVVSNDHTSKIINGCNPKITWEGIQNADYYIVTIQLSHSETIYRETQQVTTNMIIWPTDLSVITQQDWDSEHHDAHEFWIKMEAYTSNNTLMADGTDLFVTENSQ